MPQSSCLGVVGWNNGFASCCITVQPANSCFPQPRAFTSGAKSELIQDTRGIGEDSDSTHSEGAGSSKYVTPTTSKRCYSAGKMKRRRTWANSSKCDQTVQTNIEKPQDCDEYYFMNLVKVFKKFSPQKKTEIRMKIERLLFEAEFE